MNDTSPLPEQTLAVCFSVVNALDRRVDLALNDLDQRIEQRFMSNDKAFASALGAPKRL